jgi:hypothetical protein
MKKVLVLVSAVLFIACGEYSQKFDYHDGLARVVKFSAFGEDRYGYIDEQGNIVIDIKYLSAGDFNNGVALIADENHANGVIDKTGNEIITPGKYSEIKMNGDYIAVISNNKTGVCDLKGKEIIPAKYDKVMGFHKSHAIVCLQERYGIVNSETEEEKWLGEDIVGVDSLINGFAIIKSKGIIYESIPSQGMIDYLGNYVILPVFFSVHPFSNGMARVEYCESYMVLTSTTTYKDQYGRTTNTFTNNVAYISLDPLFGYYDETGTLAIPLKYYSASDFSDGWAYVCESEDSERERRVYPDYTPNNSLLAQIEHDTHYYGWETFKASHIDYSKDKKCFIDKLGKKKLTVNYDDAHNFIDGVAAVYKKDNGYGCIDKTGREIIPCKYDKDFSFSEGLAAVALNNEYGYIDKTGKEVIPFKYARAQNFSEGLAPAMLNGRWGYIDKDDNEVIPFKYHEAYLFKDRLALVKLNDKEFYIDTKGKCVKDCP